jgi:undecaprenyl diphosphate synthase
MIDLASLLLVLLASLSSITYNHAYTINLASHGLHRSHHRLFQSLQPNSHSHAHAHTHSSSQHKSHEPSKRSEMSNIPKHVAYIVDGNGRWASERGLARSIGHQHGANKTVEIVKASFELGVETITLYLFSTENWKRPMDEIQHIMLLLENYLQDFSTFLSENRIKLRVIGQTNRLPASIQKLIHSVGYQGTAIDHNIRVLCLAISYGGRDDIIQTCQRLMLSSVDPIQLTEEIFHKYTSTGLNGISDPDLIIRTSGEFRLSNFLLWQSAYAEFVSIPSYCKLMMGYQIE